ncbi:hormogonium polysaccharide secretion pseudopilin HpsC [Microcoleus sp. EPA2]|uniref:hormogonium polysaccharide secretion pseudopilin HpsC n=1 Tax=Microcoleus sp. EPA2 TaxID=2841654 RepID=UPI00312B3987
MKNLLRLLVRTQSQRNLSQAKTEKGMTLVELLVGAIMAFLIITPMLGFVVDMLNTDRREQVKSNTEQDLQAAVDFIAQDLSQAIYIYDGKGITDIKPQLPPNDISKIPILVFWKRQRIKDAVPINREVFKNVKPKDCNSNLDKCNDTDVLSLVAYYQIKDNEATWCQPSGGTCPTRIARYEIRDGVRNPDATDPTDPYYKSDNTETILSQRKDVAFNPEFDLSKPTEKLTFVDKLTDKTSGATKQEVLVNYIDHSPGPAVQNDECQTALGNPTDQRTAIPIGEATLRIPSPDGVNSFYACVDTEKNIARVTIRGNSLRRLQTDANYDANKSAFFPTASVQVQGLGARGK